MTNAAEIADKNLSIREVDEYLRCNAIRFSYLIIDTLGVHYHAARLCNICGVAFDSIYGTIQCPECKSDDTDLLDD